MITKPYVGQKVRLNKEGMRMIGGIYSPEQFAESQNVTVLSVEELPMTDCVLWEVELSGFLNKFLLTNFDIDSI